MKRFVSALGAGLGALALSVTSVGAAQAAPKPPWEKIDETFVVPAGYACSGDVTFRQVGHVRAPYDKKIRGKDYIVFESGEDMVMHLTNNKTKKHIKKKISGDFYDRLVNKDMDAKTLATGSNVFFGNGVLGILWANGTQKAYVANYFMENQRIDVYKTKGVTQELCRQVGLIAVPGKNPPPEPVA